MYPGLGNWQLGQCKHHGTSVASSMTLPAKSAWVVRQDLPDGRKTAIPGRSSVGGVRELPGQLRKRLADERPRTTIERPRTTANWRNTERSMLGSLNAALRNYFWWKRPTPSQKYRTRQESGYSRWFRGSNFEVS